MSGCNHMRCSVCVIFPQARILQQSDAVSTTAAVVGAVAAGAVGAGGGGGKGDYCHWCWVCGMAVEGAEEVKWGHNTLTNS